MCNSVTPLTQKHHCSWWFT